MKKRDECLKQSWRAAAFCLCAALPIMGQSPALSVAGEIHDPSTGAVWLLVRDDAHPGGPARLVLTKPGNVSGPVDRKLLIHAGDRIVVEEHTAIVDARLTAIALTSAAEGEKLQARMVIGGGVVTVRVVSAAVAEFATEAGQ